MNTTDPCPLSKPNPTWRDRVNHVPWYSWFILGIIAGMWIVGIIGLAS